MKSQVHHWCIVIILFFTACKEELSNAPLSTGAQPDQITILSQQEIPGGSEITFKSPANKDFLYVRAIYSPKEGQEIKVVSSLYEDKITLHGFIKEGVYPVTFYSIAQGDVLSEPLKVDVKVSKPSFLHAYDNLQVFDDFSGYTVVFDNPSEQDIRITVLTYDPLVKRYVTDYTHFSKSAKGSFRRAGYHQPQEFRFVVTDRWENHSDTLSRVVNPLEEFQMDKSKFAGLTLPPFNNMAYNSSTLFSRIWDERVGNFYYGTTGWMSYDTGPMDFAIDIGVRAKLSRIKMNHPCSPSGNFFFTAYNRYAFREFELYGSNAPNSDGSWESWDRVGTFESIRPSGMTAEEMRNFACALGEDFFVPGEAQSYRYYRIKVLAQWGGSGFFSAVDELTFFGAQQD